MPEHPPIALPSRPGLRYLKQLAKSVLRQHRNRLHSCCDVLRNLRVFSDASIEKIINTSVTLQQVQHALALAYGHKNWKSLRDTVATRTYPAADTHRSALEGESQPRSIILWEKLSPIARTCGPPLAVEMVHGRVSGLSAAIVAPSRLPADYAAYCLPAFKRLRSQGKGPNYPPPHHYFVYACDRPPSSLGSSDSRLISTARMCLF